MRRGDCRAARPDQFKVMDAVAGRAGVKVAVRVGAGLGIRADAGDVLVQVHEAGVALILRARGPLAGYRAVDGAPHVRVDGLAVGGGDDLRATEQQSNQRILYYY